MGFGGYFEEFEVGAVLRHTPGRTLSETDEAFFCTLTMNHSPLESQSQQGQTAPQGRMPVSGPLVLATALGMSAQQLNGRSIASLGYDEIRHVAPVFQGDTIYAETLVLDARELGSRPDRGVIHMETHVRNQRGETVLTFRRQMLVPKRNHAAEGRTA